MDIRNIGTPITASQRRSYSETPDNSFYATYQAAFQAQNAKDSGDARWKESPALERILGTTHAELSAMRGVSTESQAVYAAVLNKAYGAGGIDNSRQFLATLSALEMDAVRQNHSLAEPIDTASLSEEGAANLLLPEGYSVDLNHDGIDEVGAAHMAHFPPRDAPDAFKEAWFQTTANMDEGSAMTYGLMMHGAVYGMQIDGKSQGPLHAADSMDSYRRIVGDYLAALETQKSFLADGQYERDKHFFTRLQTFLASGG